LNQDQALETVAQELDCGEACPTHRYQ